MISVEGLGKSYLVGHQSQSKERYTALRDVVGRNLKDFGRKAMDMARGKQIIQGDEVEEFWALKDVSFDVNQGEVVGIIGRNGAGKSTLLKILSRITEPTAGRVTLRGRVASLLEVGTGFHPELSGRENIFLNGAILGMTRSEIKRKFDEIVDFAGVEKFLDTPVKRYSSGMYVRLAFAVAAHLDPEILVVDEVLAVGDAEFQKKCLGKMKDVAEGGRTVLFVSHNMGAIKSLCQHALLLNRGGLLYEGQTDVALSKYLESDASDCGEFCPEKPGDGDFKINKIRISNCQKVSANFTTCEPVFVDLDFTLKVEVTGLRVGFILANAEGVVIFEIYDSDAEDFQHTRQPGRYNSRCKIPAELLMPGTIYLSFNAGIPGVKNFASLSNIMTFSVVDMSVNVKQQIPRQGAIRPMLPWETRELSNV